MGSEALQDEEEEEECRGGVGIDTIPARVEFQARANTHLSTKATKFLSFFAKQKLDKGFFLAFVLSRKQKYLCPGAPLKHTSSPLGI